MINQSGNEIHEHKETQKTILKKPDKYNPLSKLKEIINQPKLQTLCHWPTLLLCQYIKYHRLAELYLDIYTCSI